MAQSHVNHTSWKWEASQFPDPGQTSKLIHCLAGADANFESYYWMWKMYFSEIMPSNLIPKLSYKVTLTLLHWLVGSMFPSFDPGWAVTILEAMLCNFQDFVRNGGPASTWCSLSQDASSPTEPSGCEEGNAERTHGGTHLKRTENLASRQLASTPRHVGCKPSNVPTPSLFTVLGDTEWSKDELSTNCSLESWVNVTVLTHQVSGLFVTQPQRTETLGRNSWPTSGLVRCEAWEHGVKKTQFDQQSQPSGQQAPPTRASNSCHVGQTWMRAPRSANPDLPQKVTYVKHTVDCISQLADQGGYASERDGQTINETLEI